MSVTKIKEKTIYTLWGRAGGICEICGEPLAIDPLTKKLKHRGYVAHIYGEKKAQQGMIEFFPKDIVMILII